MTEERKFTDQEVKDAIRVGILESKMDDMETVVPEVFATLKILSSSVNKIPGEVSLEIIACREKIDNDMKKYIHDNFVDKVAMNAMETRIESKISKASWIVTAAILAFGFYDFLGTHTNLFAG